ncbi:hemolysin family protein [Gorillibacterium timonense]|uniref:hemolysin family protein n=1 Tax=Gorillibacterium timonense TaxID=1689269 RepID=UPI00071CDE6F|nr:hemolysin family protein [Gorillibacterium timonense]
MEDGLSILLNLVLVLILVLLNGFFVAAEFALVRVRATRLAELASSGNSRAKVAQHVASKLDAYLSACQLGITLASLGLGWVGEPAIADLIVEPFLNWVGAPESLIHPISLGVAFAVITFLHIVLGELAPKSIAIFQAETTSLWLSAPLLWFYRLMYPIIWLLNGAANTILRWIGIEPASEHEASHTEEEIRILMKESQKGGHIDQNELTLMENIFEFSERLAREVMIPRTVVECLYADLPFEENLTSVMETRHTRYPVVMEEKDNVLGFVLSADVYNAALSQDRASAKLEPMIRPVPHIPESMEISQVLKVMQRERVHLAVVVDEYGGMAGIIAMEDILEEIVGDIHDEWKEERPEVEVFDSYTSVDGRFLLDKLNDLFHLDIEDEEIDTVAGWVYQQLEEKPKVGMQVLYDGIIFEIAELDNLRIDRVTIHALPYHEELLEDASG